MVQSGFRNKILLGALALMALIVSGCVLQGGGSLTNLPNDETAIVKLKISLGRIDAQSGINPNVVSKSSAIQINRLIVNFVSNLGDTVRDTVSSASILSVGTNLFSDTVLVDVSLRAFRWWNIEIETRDQFDSVIHKGSAGPFASKGGQVMDLTIPLLKARYLLYEARYNLPSEVYAVSSVDSERIHQKIYFYRLVLEIDSAIVRDSTSFPPSITSFGNRFIYSDTAKLKNSFGKEFFRPYTGLGADTVTHIQSYEYVKVGLHEFKMSAYGYLEGDSIGRNAPRLLFQGKSVIGVSQNGVTDVQTVNLDWMGPGSTFTSGDSVGGANWNGIHLSVTLGRVRTGSVTVGIVPDFPE